MPSDKCKVCGKVERGCDTLCSCCEKDRRPVTKWKTTVTDWSHRYNNIPQGFTYCQGGLRKYKSTEKKW